MLRRQLASSTKRIRDSRLCELVSVPASWCAPCSAGIKTGDEKVRVPRSIATRLRAHTRAARVRATDETARRHWLSVVWHSHTTSGRL